MQRNQEVVEIKHQSPSMVLNCLQTPALPAWVNCEQLFSWPKQRHRHNFALVHRTLFTTLFQPSLYYGLYAAMAITKKNPRSNAEGTSWHRSAAQHKAQKSFLPFRQLRCFAMTQTCQLGGWGVILFSFFFPPHKLTQLLWKNQGAQPK